MSVGGLSDFFVDCGLHRILLWDNLFSEFYRASNERFPLTQWGGFVPSVSSGPALVASIIIVLPVIFANRNRQDLLCCGKSNDIRHLSGWPSVSSTSIDIPPASAPEDEHSFK